MASINTDLEKLYLDKWDGVQEMRKEICGLSNPLMLYIKDEADFEAADIKVMYFGRETQGYFGDDFPKIIERYSEWHDTRDIVNDKNPNPFALRVNKFRKQMDEKAAKSGLKVRYLWNNIIKMDLKGTFPPVKVRRQIREKFDVILNEIRIVKPSIIWFATGPDAYPDIDNVHFKGVRHENIPGFEQGELCKLILPYLPELESVKYAFRSFNPSAWCGGKHSAEERMTAIINEIDFSKITDI
jgi:hypothetical protein